MAVFNLSLFKQKLLDAGVFIDDLLSKEIHVFQRLFLVFDVAAQLVTNHFLSF